MISKCLGEHVVPTFIPDLQRLKSIRDLVVNVFVNGLQLRQLNRERPSGSSASVYQDSIASFGLARVVADSRVW
jgi:hypothetical protein